MDNAVSVVKSVLYELMVDGIKYEKIGEKVYEMTLFEDNELEIYLDWFTFKVDKPDKTIYDNYIPLDSSVENQFARDYIDYGKAHFRRFEDIRFKGPLSSVSELTY